MKFKRIYLTGFRATGKSTFGRILAQKLGRSYFDMDFLISERTGKNAQILTKNGTDWTEFRTAEKEVLEETLEMENAVISCGGGVGVNDVTDEVSGKTFGELHKALFSESADNLIILLTADKKIIEERLRRQFTAKKIMPFLNSDGSGSQFKGKDLVEHQVRDSLEALEKRREKYEDLADLEIDTSVFKLPESMINLSAVIGDPVSHSLSPKMHNAGYAALGIENWNLFIACKVKEAKLEKFIDAVRDLEIKGVSVTVPHKEKIVALLDDVDETAKKIGAVNTVVNIEGVLTGYNTDWIGAVNALEEKTGLKDKKTAVIGAGGAARAVVYGLVSRGANVKIFNRTIKKAKSLAAEFGCNFSGMESIGEISGMDIVINTTTVGMNTDESPVDKKFLKRDQIIMDIVFSPKETKLLQDAKEQGAVVVYGYEMLLSQGSEQFKMYTGFEAPIKEMEEVLIDD